MAKPDSIKPIGGKKKAKLLVYGIAGAGKTRLIGSTPGRTLIIRPATDHTTSIGKLASGVSIDEWEVNNWNGMTEALDFCKFEASKHYDWVWYDGISNGQDAGLDDVWADTLARKPERGKYGLDKSEYGINMHRLGVWIRAFIAMDRVNLGITAHPYETTAGGGYETSRLEEGDAILMPWIQGKNMPMKICGYMNGVFYLRVTKDSKTKKTIRELITDITPREYGATIYAKNQLFPGKKLINPTMPELLALINGSGRANMASARKAGTRTAVRRPARRVTK